jgi:transcriptional regulator with XRE-family HTH domain
MAQRSRLKLPPLKLGPETIGQRIRRLRTERGLTQVQLAEKIGLIQLLVSDYERGKLRLHGEMVARFALALGVSSDEILGLARPGSSRSTGDDAPSLTLVRRMRQIEELPAHQKRALLRTIDMFLQAARPQAA